MVRVDQILVIGGVDVCGATHRLLDNLGHLKEPTLVLEESTIHDLVGCVQDTRHVATTLDSLEGEGQAAELLEIRLEELERMVEQVEALASERQSLGVGEGVLDRQTHVRHAQLGLHRSVLKLHSTMDDTLRMHQHLYLTGLDTKEPLGLDHLETLVHHRSRVDGDLGAHIPRGVFQRISLRHMGYLVHRLQAEGTTRGRQQNLFNAVLILADKTLEDGRVLAIDGQNLGTIANGQVADQLSCHHERLLVGQTDGLVGLDGVDRRRQSCEAHHSRQHHVDGSSLDNLVERLGSSIHLHLGQVAHQPLQVVVSLFVGYDHSGRLELMGLLGEQFHLVVGCQTVDLVQV